ncbi:MAG: TIGR01440 family protein [Ruminococcaceae bacterium]|nr:TIGR01440 family protein [Oscillospiraceae bacterium]
MNIKEQAMEITRELVKISKIKSGEIFVVGCSSSEIMGNKIGTNSDVDAAKEVFEGIYSVLQEHGIYLAAQCCEHLNRALVIEQEAAEKFNLSQVNAIPQKKAGGSFATTAYQAFSSPVLVEEVKAKAGMDIGETLIGMHMAPVAVPVRCSLRSIGEARVNCARSRLKFVGGIRAIYNEDLL